MIIKVTGYLTFRKIIGQREIYQPDDHPITLREMLRTLAIDLGQPHGTMVFDLQTGTVNQSVAVMLNGRHYNHLPNGLLTHLQNLDEIAVFPPGAGG